MGSYFLTCVRVGSKAVASSRETLSMPEARLVRCAIYARKSTEEGLALPFNSLDAQREWAEAYIASQRHMGWTALERRYEDGGYTGANLERPALRALMEDIESGQVDCVVVYKVDRLSRSLLDFARLIGAFEEHGVSLVSVTQQLNTTDSLGRLTLNILLSFAQFERELIAERTRDKMRAARRKGKWLGGRPILGYDVDPEQGGLKVNAGEAPRVRFIFQQIAEGKSAEEVLDGLARRGWTTKQWTSRSGRDHRGSSFPGIRSGSISPERDVPREATGCGTSLQRRTRRDRRCRALAAGECRRQRMAYLRGSEPAEQIECERAETQRGTSRTED